MGVVATRYPFMYIGSKGQITGFDAEMAKRLCAAIDRKIEFVDMNFNALLVAIQTGNVDIGLSTLSITDERRESADFTEPYMEMPIVALCRAENLKGAYYDSNTVLVTLGEGPAQAVSGVWDSLRVAFAKNLVKDGRWRLVANGLGVTLLISLASMLFGTLLAFPLCFLRMSRSKLLRAIDRVYVMLLRGAPMVVFLMIMYYIVFGRVVISSVSVAIAAFSMNVAAFASEILYSAIDSIDKGQTEAARTLGFSQSRAFLYVTLPQTIKRALPAYAGEFITTIKGTSIVGYVAIEDLTKATDIIRSQTFDAVFPLIMTAVIYLVITISLILLLERSLGNLGSKETSV